MKKRPSIFLFLCALMGAFFGLYQEAPLTIFWGIAALPLLLTLAFKKHLARISAFFVFVMVIVAAKTWHEKNIYDHDTAMISKDDTIHGIVIDVWPKSGHELQALVQSQRLRLKVNLIEGASALAVKAGDHISFKAELKAFQPSLSPVLFNAYRFGLSHGLHAQVTIKEPDLVMITAGKAPWIARLRSYVRQHISEHLSPHQASLLLALTLGETGLFSPDQKEIYQNIGAQHLLAVSGLQITMLTGLCLLLFIPCFTCLLPPRLSHRSFIISVILSLALVWLFVALCHNPRSAIRAALMSTLVLLPSILGRKVDIFDALFMSGFLSLLVDPLSIADLGFLLSYAASFGLLCAHHLGASLSKAIKTKSSFGALLFLWGTSSLGAFLATLPITLFFFGTWAPAAMLANWLLVPVAAALQIPAIIFALLGGLTAWALPLRLASFCASLIELFAQVLSDIFGGISHISHLSPAIVLVLSCGFFCLFLSLLARHKTALIASCLLIFAPLLSLISLAPKALKITVIPVGQGDASLVEMPSGQKLLIDAGGNMLGNYDPGHAIVVPTLKRLGVDELDILAISHPDPDHILGAFAVLEEMPVKEIWHSGFKAEHPLTKRLLERAAAKNIPVKNTPALLGIHRFGETELNVLAPNTHTNRAYFENLKANDNSLVLRLEHEGKALLWPGDLEKKGEDLLLSEKVLLEADILKAPHHGSRTSSTSEFIERVNPKFVIYSTGRDNRFGFPHHDVVDRYHQKNIKSFNTAIDGEITINITKSGIDIAGFLSPCKTNQSGSCLPQGQPYERSTKSRLQSLQQV